MQFHIIHTPQGGIDTDSHDTMIDSTDYRDALNLRNVSTYIGKQSVLTNIKGNVIVSYSLGGVKHKCIGSYEDKKGRTIIYFLWAKDGNHKILRYNSEKVSAGAIYGVVEEVIKYNFGWKETTKITSIDLVDGKLLYWTDPKPRKINIEKAILTEKIKTWKIFFPKNFLTAVAAPNISVSIINRTTGALVLNDTTFTILVTDTTSQILSNFTAYLNDVAIFGNYLSAEYCNDCCVEVSEKSVSDYLISITSSAPFIVVPENWYGNTLAGGSLSDRTFERIKYPPIYQPIVTHKADANKLYNLVKKKVFQFRTQFHYDDNESSKLSPISQISINNTQSEALLDSLNYIEVNVNNSIFDVVNLAILKRISILFRERNSGVWRSLGQYDICDLLEYSSGTKLIYKFYNDSNSLGISDVLASSQYDKVPIEANASNFVENRIVDGGITDNYDTDRCIDLTPQVNVLDVVQDEYVTLTGKIKIMSYRMNDSSFRSGTVGVDDYPFYLPSSIEPQTGKIRGLITHDTTDNNPYPVFGGAMYGYGGGWDFDITLGIKDTWKQTLPEAGWAVYSAGTDMMTVSKQIDFGTDLFQHASGAIDASSVGQIIKIGKHFQAYQEAYSTFTLVVPKNSKHIIRIASHLCSFGDKLGLGDYYDLNKSLYQKTSTYVTGHFNSAMTVWNGNVKEILVDTTAMSGVNDIGTFIIQDLCPSFDELTGPGMIGSAPYYSWKNIVGYLYDNLGDTNPNSEGGIPVNNAWIKCSVADTTGVNSLRMEKIDGFTDHNGFYFLTSFHLDPTNDDNGLYLSAYQVSGIAAPLINANILDFYGATNYAFSNYANIDAWVNATKIKAFDSPVYSGDITNIIEQTCQPTGYLWDSGGAVPTPVVNLTDSATYEIVMNTDLATARANQAVRVYGNVGIGNVSVVCDGGNVVKSNSVGFFEIYVWGKMYGSYTVLTTANPIWLSGRSKYHAVYTPTAGATGTIIFNVNGESIDTIAAYSVNYAATLPSADLNSGTNAITLETSNVKARKRGGKYIVGIRYYDYANRSSDVINTDKGIVYIPFITEDLNKYLPNYAVPSTYQYGIATISVTLGASCPSWAYYYQILISNNMNQLSYLQWKVNDVKYILRVKQTGLPEISTSKVDSSATHLRLSLENLNTYYNRNNDSQLGYSYNVGDKIRLITNQLGTYYNGLYEYEIVSWESPNSVLVKYVGVDIEVGSFVEIFTQATNLTDKIFYEVGETYPCTAPGTSGNQHGTTSISLSGGDTYWRKRKIPVFSDFFNITTNYNVIVEDAGISDFYPSKDSDIGRIGIEDPLYKRIYRPSTVRVSNNYVLGSNINGLSENENVDDIDLGISYGDIMKMVHVGDSLVAIHKNKCVSMYIGKVLARTVDSGIMTTTNEFIGDHRPLTGDYGTQNPESIKVSGNSIFGWDSYKGLVWKYDNNGIDIISYKKMKAYFENLANSVLWDCPAVYDDLYNEYILTATITKSVVVLDANNTMSGFAITFTDSVDFDNLAVNDLILVEYPYLGQTKQVYGHIDVLAGTITGTLLEDVGTINADIKITFKNSAQTIAYSDMSRLWTSRYSFTPEGYCGTKKEMVSFKDGFLWIHDKSSTYNNFYGVQHKSSLTIVANGLKERMLDEIKLWLAISLRTFQTNKLFNWDLPTIKNKTQLSWLFNGAFRKKEEYWHKEFNRDDNSIGRIVNGKNLRSQTLEITMENDAIVETNLNQIDITLTKSNKNT